MTVCFVTMWWRGCSSGLDAGGDGAEECVDFFNFMFRTAGLWCRLKPTNIWKSMVLRWNGTSLCTYMSSIEFMSDFICHTIYSEIEYDEECNGWFPGCMLYYLWLSCELDLAME